MNWDDTFWIVDVEGNGGQPPEIVELAMFEMKELALTGNRKHWLIRPEQPISPIATRIHGIKNDDVAGAPTFEEIAEDVLTWIETAPIIGHNVKVEVDTLMRALPGWEPVAALDTLRLARSLKPGLESYSLTKIADALKLSVKVEDTDRDRPHSAPYDALLTAALFARLLEEAPPQKRSAALSEANIVDAQQGLAL